MGEIIAAGEAVSVGLLSPFRAQVDALRDAVAHRFSGADFLQLTQRHQLRVGTAHAFQGDERDVMLLSFAIDAGIRGMGMRFLERPDVFNVSITRARSKQIIFCSVDPAQLPHDSILRQYLASAKAAEGGRPASRGESAAGVAGFEIAEELKRDGAAVLAHRQVAGVEFDLVVLRGRCCMAIDLIGFPGRGRNALELERYKMFRRAGTPVFPLSYSNWTFAKEASLQALRTALHHADANGR